MNRRKFLTQAGLGSIALASLPALATPALADAGQTGFHFASLSAALTVDGVAHRLFMAGDGKVTPSQVVGSGMFNHFNVAPPGVPKPLLAFGTWKAKQLISLNLIGTYGAQGAGVLELLVDLVPVGKPVVEAMLEVVCNAGAAGLITGEEEGFVLTIPGTPFVPGGAAGPFKPLNPPVGVTVFSVLNEQRD